MKEIRDTEDTAYMTSAEIAKKLRITARTVNRWCQLRQLRAVRAGRQWRILPADLEAFLAAQLSARKESSK